MEVESRSARFSGNGEVGLSVLDSPAERTRSKSSRTSRKVPPSKPSVRAASPGGKWFWTKALGGGLLLSTVLFAVLAMIQPVFNGNERIEIPAAVRMSLDGSPVQKARAVTKRQPEPQRQEQRAEESRSRPKALASRRTAPEQAAQTQARRELAQVQKSINVFNAIGGGGGGGGPAIDLALAEESTDVLEKAKGFRDWEERRRRIREGGASGRSRSDLAGNSRGGAIGGIAGAGRDSAGYFPPPKYPSGAEKQGTEGWVKVRMLVGITGAVEKFEIVAAQPAGIFETSVQEILPRWHFSPLMDDGGRPTEFWEDYTFQFKLEDATL